MDTNRNELIGVQPPGFGSLLGERGRCRPAARKRLSSLVWIRVHSWLNCIVPPPGGPRPGSNSGGCAPGIRLAAWFREHRARTAV